MRALTLRSFYCFCALVFGGALVVFGLVREDGHGFSLPMVSANPETLKEELARIKRENAMADEQIKVFAEEIGVMQSKIDRFDMIGEKLFNDDEIGDMLEDHVHEIEGQGSSEKPALDKKVSLDELTEQFAQLKHQTEDLDGVMEDALELVSKSYLNRSSKPNVWPVISDRTRLTSAYGYRTDPFNKKKKWHSGVDIGGGWNVPIVSSGDGIVTFSGYRFAYGQMVEVMHPGGFVTRYGHLNKALAKNGQKVKAGDTIALMGSTGRSTGPHLHFEVLVGGVKVNPYAFIKADKTRMRRYAANLKAMKASSKIASAENLRN
ncbi:MAG: peptidoglycan DD-metalloendopeptidase family protein [Alphaproteobacteria bacterium]|nr:peptidoglycan DD-metalloendopeptidase family protein [Alphaproteobacteria bacterium]